MQQPPNDDSSQLSRIWQDQPPTNASQSFSPPVYFEQPQAVYPQPGPYQPYSPQPPQSPPFGQQLEQPLWQPQPFPPGYPPQLIYQPQPQSFPPGYAPQPMYQPQSQPFPLGYSQQSMPMMQQNIYMQPAAPNVVQVNINQKQPGFLMRALYFIFIGWWAGFWWLQFGYLLCLLVVTLPLGLVMLNRLPQVLTLRPNNQQVNVTVVGNVTTINVGGVQQQSFLIRALYYVFIGFWLGYIWASVGYSLCLTILGMPLGLIMLNRLPMVLTLRRN